MSLIVLQFLSFLQFLFFRLSKELLDPERLKIDHSQCCSNKPEKSVVQKEKRKLTNELNCLSKNKKKCEDTPATTWTIQEEDEVVCTPDLPSLIEEDEPQPKPQEISPVPENPPPVKSQIRVKGFAKEYENRYQRIQPYPPMMNYHTVQPSPAILQQPPEILPSLLSNRPPPLLYPANRPIVTNLQTIPIRHYFPSNNPARVFTPSPVLNNQNIGKIDWFDKAAQQTANINGKLTAQLVELAHEQRTATSVEQMAFVHNKLQELLCNSVNSLIQVRKSLRTDFLNDLQKMKFLNTQNKLKNDIILVNNSSISNPVPTNSINLNNASVQNKSNFSKPRLKVKTLSELANVPSECICIPDDPSKKNSLSFESNNVLYNQVEIPEINKEIKENSLSENCVKTPVLNTNQRTTENHEDAIENLNSNLQEISEDQLHRMKSVKVCLEKNFSPGTLKSNPRKHYTSFNIKSELLKNSKINDSCKHLSEVSVNNQTVNNNAVINIIHQVNEDTNLK